MNHPRAFRHRPWASRGDSHQHPRLSRTPTLRRPVICSAPLSPRCPADPGRHPAHRRARVDRADARGGAQNHDVTSDQRTVWAAITPELATGRPRGHASPEPTRCWKARGERRFLHTGTSPRPAPTVSAKGGTGLRRFECYHGTYPPQLCEALHSYSEPVARRSVLLPKITSPIAASADTGRDTPRIRSG